MSGGQAYCCIEPQCNRAPLMHTDKGLACPNGHLFTFVAGTDVPVFFHAPEDVNEYTIQDAATVHDNSLRWVFNTFGTDEHTLRESLISRLQLAKGARLLVTGAGAGNDLPYLAKKLDGDGEIFAQDVAQEMLLAGARRHRDMLCDSGVSSYFSVSDATNLPFADGYFDAAYHFGGINLFSDIRKGIDEMNRVVKPGGKVVIGDEGVAPWLKNSEYGKMLIKNNPLYDCNIPLELLPESARSVRLSWELKNCFYVIEFTVSDEPLRISIDVPHIGKRGGSIRTRYFGQLEGVEPALRDRIYAEAERLGLSRVEYIESLLRTGLPSL
jgi:SAM-dependent methyltransferase